MRASRRVVLCIVVLLLALPVMAAPADGVSWWSWLAEGWETVVRVLAGSETPPAEEPEAEPEALPADGVENTVCDPLVTVCTEGRPSLDPDG